MLLTGVASLPPALSYSGKREYTVGELVLKFESFLYMKLVFYRASRQYIPDRVVPPVLPLNAPRLYVKELSDQFTDALGEVRGVTARTQAL